MSILAALTRSIGDPEPIATKGLAYILQQYPAAREALQQFLKANGIDCQRFASAGHEESLESAGRVDIACKNMAGSYALLIEGKFWAGLTDNQPNNYLQTLGNDEKSALLFVGPDKRFELLRVELSEKIAVRDYPPLSGNMPLACSKLPGRPSVLLSSWRSIGGVIRGRFEADSNRAGANDLEQIMSLADMQDSNAILPFHAEELSNLEIAKRQMDFADLAIKIADKALQKPLVTGERLRTTATAYGYGRYLWIASIGAWLGYAADWWWRFGRGPMWLIFLPTSFGRAAEVRTALSKWESASPPRLYVKDGQVGVPIILTPGVETQRVVENAVSQIEAVAAELAALPPAQSSPPPVTDDNALA